ncbi:MAG: non-ribosomal peptide synthetase, partial [Lachnospiraceae bacterium]|nr:non-ribosomal peptide synthetase [Candidatus Colinaster equi]
GRHITYRELYHQSGKVYNYLHSKNIGKEDVVMITLPRGAMPIVALFGVWRAGAAVIMLETDYPEKKKEYIKHNANCKLVIDSTLYSEMTQYDMLSGYEKADPHDLAYIVYTSGTTGVPKGVMHEYGTIDYCVRAMPYNGKPLFSIRDRALLLSPLHFTASIMLIESVLFNCASIVTLPLESTQNIERLCLVMSDYVISVAFFTPSLLRLIHNFPESVKRIITGAEPANNIYFNDIEVYVKYGQSESGYSILSCLIDRKYEVAPAGKKTIEEADVWIINDNGEPVQDGEIGEICFKNPYFRGYVGLSDKNKALFYKDHIKTGDMGKYLPDGNIVICGRKDDMIKINGNRVEPAEIEKAVKSALGVDWAAVRVFDDGRRNYICAYYVDEPLVDIDAAKDQLRKTLASYMMPSCFMRIDRIPTNGNGKFNRNDLPIPDSSKRNNEYISPNGETEKQLCEAMRQVLKLDVVGACDDFYEIGGDSLATIELITLLNWDLLEATMVYEGRTPRKIVALYTAALESQRQNLEEQNQRALDKDQPLSGEQMYLFDYHCRFPRSLAWNLPILLELDDSVDIDRVKAAVDICLKAHPVFSTVYLFDDDRNLVQRYERNKHFDIKIEEISERKFADLLETLVQPYELINQPLYRARLFRTEKSGYLFIDMHHSISDGTSLHILVEDICKAYESVMPEADYYYLNLKERRKDCASYLYEKGKIYYAETLDKYEWSTLLDGVVDTAENVYGNISSMLPIEQKEYEDIQRIFGCSKNGFFIATAVLALHIYNNKDDILISWLYNGRKRSIEQHTIGTLYQTFFVGEHFHNEMKLSDFFKNVRRQIYNGIYYSSYPIVELNKACREGNGVLVIYQSDIRTFRSENEMKFSLVDLPYKIDAADNYLYVEIHDTDDGCKLYLDYNAAVYKKDSINKFHNLFTQIACCFGEHISEPDILLSKIVEEIKTKC